MCLQVSAALAMDFLGISMRHVIPIPPCIICLSKSIHFVFCKIYLMQTEQTTKRSYTVTAKGNPETFQYPKQFLSWSLALRHLNKYIKEQPMSILLTTVKKLQKHTTIINTFPFRLK